MSPIPWIQGRRGRRVSARGSIRVMGAIFHRTWGWGLRLCALLYCTDAVLRGTRPTCWARRQEPTPPPPASPASAHSLVHSMCPDFLLTSHWLRMLACWLNNRVFFVASYRADTCLTTSPRSAHGD